MARSRSTYFTDWLHLDHLYQPTPAAFSAQIIAARGHAPGMAGATSCCGHGGEGQAEPQTIQKLQWVSSVAAIQSPWGTVQILQTSAVTMGSFNVLPHTLLPGYPHLAYQAGPSLCRLFSQSNILVPPPPPPPRPFPLLCIPFLQGKCSGLRMTVCEQLQQAKSAL